MVDANTRPFTTAAGHPTVEVRFRVRYFETDAMGIVHHASYITWFEEGRSAFTRTLGYPYCAWRRKASAWRLQRSTRATTTRRATMTKYW